MTKKISIVTRIQCKRILSIIQVENLKNFNHSGAVTEYCRESLILIPEWISNYIHHKVRNEITYPFLNFKGATVEV